MGARAERKGSEFRDAGRLDPLERSLDYRPGRIDLRSRFGDSDLKRRLVPEAEPGVGVSFDLHPVDEESIGAARDAKRRSDQQQRKGANERRAPEAPWVGLRSGRRTLQKIGE